MKRSAGEYYGVEDFARDGWAVVTRRGAPFETGLTEREALKLAKQLNTAYAVGYAEAKDDIRQTIELMPLTGT
ncbi:hypothetical protein [Arenibaculum pallidiluteum]|uniref:hypothetical protein n=1 Tax=Arenibaculum pallidiluteum TaxID=2812559 RepID=UPI001A95FD11|nr:hypothetical protein [Arenibaculum pallidiluteum]